MKGFWWTLVVLILAVSVVLRSNFLFLLSLLLALVGGVSLIWSRYCLAAVTYRRRLGASHLFYGEETEMDVEIVNAKPLPLPWLRAEDEVPENVDIRPGRLSQSYLPMRRILTNLLSLRWYERVTRHYKLRGTHRGAFWFGPVELTAEDIFGFSTRSLTVPETQLLVVYPKFVPLMVLGLPAMHPFGDYKTAERLGEDPLRLMGAREYQPGDSYRYVHWKASARRQQLQTKVFEPSAARPLAIFLNINTFEHVWEGVDRQMQELAITTAASVARYGWENGYQIGLYANSVMQPGGDRVRIHPGSHPDQFIWILDALAKIIEYGRWPIEAIMHVESHRLSYGTTIVVVTAVVTESLKRTLLYLRGKHHAVVLISMGEERLYDIPPGIVYYYVGTREEWHGLASLKLA